VIGCAVVALAPGGSRLYLNRVSWGWLISRPAGDLFVQTVPMAQPISTQHEPSCVLPPDRKVASIIAMGLTGFGAVALAGALVLWFHYGTAVFFEMIAAGFNACF
jgi:hypothetical protein